MKVSVLHLASLFPSLSSLLQSPICHLCCNIIAAHPLVCHLCFNIIAAHPPCLSSMLHYHCSPSSLVCHLCCNIIAAHLPCLSSMLQYHCSSSPSLLHQKQKHLSQKKPKLSFFSYFLLILQCLYTHYYHFAYHHVDTDGRRSIPLTLEAICVLKRRKSLNY